MSYQDFKNQVNGKAFDIDGAYGAQCWDGYAKYCQYLGVPYANCTRTGYVRDIWEQRKSNGTLKYFDEVSVMQQGDIAVFKPTANWTPYSHIAIFERDIDGTYGYFLGQNQGGWNGAFNVVKLPYYATYDTAFRRKGVKETNTNTTAKKATVTAKKPDQVLTVGSKVKFGNFKITKVDEKNNLVYVPTIGGWVGAGPLTEVNASDGKQDQVLRVGATATYSTEMTVGAVDAQRDIVYINELGFWVKASILTETKNGK